ncbi:MAG TPA: potassium channel family protein [Xanthobacteraceae bacterium]|nr:potassium channel family protein [Xanthobacteraceae bacterium]
MSPPAPKSVRRRFLVALGRGLYVTWPVLSGILVIELALGLLIGFVEGWSVGEAVYFSFVTGLTIGYGDIVPRQTLTRALAVVIGFGGILLTGLVAGIAVNAMRATLTDGAGR